MLLAVDIGNTQVKYGVFDGAQLRLRLRVASRRDRTPDEWRLQLENLLESGGISAGGLRHAIIASVVPSITEALAEAAARVAGEPAMIVGPALPNGLTIRGRPLRELGADRVAQIVAARSLGIGNAIVVALGTATVIDAIEAGGDYRGGVIAPGLRTSAEALYSKAALLREVPLTAPESVLGLDTTRQVQAGLLIGWASLVEGIVSRMRGQLPGGWTTIGTGGLCSQIAPLTSAIDRLEPDLALTGLLQIARLNHLVE